MRPAPGYVVENVDSMLEAGDVIKQSGKELLCAAPQGQQNVQSYEPDYEPDLLS